MELKVLIDPRTYPTRTGFGVALCGSPSSLRTEPYIWAISDCCAFPIHFIRRKPGMAKVCSACANDIDAPWELTGVSLSSTPPETIESWVREWTGLDNLEVRVDI